jgi:hypothetical protein
MTGEGDDRVPYGDSLADTRNTGGTAVATEKTQAEG